jgi:hypothetical protein
MMVKRLKVSDPTRRHYLDRAVQSGYLVKDAEGYGAPVDTYEWVADLIGKYQLLRSAYGVWNSEGIKLDFVLFCVCAVQSGYLGDPATIMPGINSTNGDEK